MLPKDGVEDLDAEEDKPKKEKEQSSQKTYSFLNNGKWNVDKSDKGITLSNDLAQIDLDVKESIKLINGILDGDTIRFRDEVSGKIAYVFVPKGDGYVLKSDDYKSGIVIDKETIGLLTKSETESSEEELPNV